MIGGEAGNEELARSPGMTEPVTMGHLGVDKQERACGHFEPVRFLEHQACIDERRNHQAVPVREHLVIEAGPHPFGARCQQLLAHRRKFFLVLHAAR